MEETKLNPKLMGKEDCAVTPANVFALYVKEITLLNRFVKYLRVAPD